MNYYKIIKDGTFIGVATTYDMRKFQLKHSVFLICEEDDAQYIQCERILYHDKWMNAPLSDPYEEAVVKQINKEDYDILFNAVKSNEEIIVPEETRIDIQLDSIDKDDQYIVEFIRNSKLNELRYACNKSIINGISIESDGDAKVYSYTLEDQSNLSSLYMMGNGGLYHANNEEFRYYSANEIKEIYVSQRINQMDNQIYYNNLKSYVETLDNVKEIDSIKYGQELPEPYLSNYKRLLNEVYKMYERED